MYTKFSAIPKLEYVSEFHTFLDLTYLPPTPYL